VLIFIFRRIGKFKENGTSVGLRYSTFVFSSNSPVLLLVKKTIILDLMYSFLIRCGLSYFLREHDTMLIYLNRKKEVKNLLKVGVGAWLNARKVMQHYIFGLGLSKLILWLIIFYVGLPPLNHVLTPRTKATEVCSTL
jgi:hypothetical protein